MHANLPIKIGMEQISELSYWTFTIKTANKLKDLGVAQQQKENAKSAHIRHQK